MTDDADTDSLVGQAQDLATGNLLDVRRSDVTPSQLLTKLGKVADGAAASVPCGSCTACCWYGRTDVKPHEESAENLEHLQLEQDAQGFYLKHREDGGCIHLSADNGCMIHAHRPRVCRAYDCRVLGLAGLAPASSPGHTAPAWQFPLSTPLDRAIVLAAHMAAQPYMEACQKGEPDPPGNVLTIILKGTYENLPEARAAIAACDRMASNT